MLFTPYHPTRAEYYTLKGCRIEFGCPNSMLIRKIILSDYLETVLKYTFTQPNL
jgi:hypothetical protein